MPYPPGMNWSAIETPDFTYIHCEDENDCNLLERAFTLLDWILTHKPDDAEKLLPRFVDAVNAADWYLCVGHPLSIECLGTLAEDMDYFMHFIKWHDEDNFFDEERKLWNGFEASLDAYNQRFNLDL